MKLKNKLKCLCWLMVPMGTVLIQGRVWPGPGGGRTGHSQRRSSVVLSRTDGDTGGRYLCDTQALGGPRARLSGLSTERVDCWRNHKVYDRQEVRQEDCVQ